MSWYEPFVHEPMNTWSILVPGALVGRDRAPVLLAPLHLEERLGHVVGREDRRRRARLGPHVGDRRTLGHCEVLEPRADELEEVADAALHRDSTQDLERDVFRADVRRELAGEHDLHHLRHGEEERPAAHTHGDVHAAGADGQHAEPAARRRVRVGADERLARHAEALVVDLVADTVSVLRELGAVVRGDRLQEDVVVGRLALEPERGVVGVGDGELGADLVDPERLELEPRHRPGGILGQALVHADPDLGSAL